MSKTKRAKRAPIFGTMDTVRRIVAAGRPKDDQRLVAVLMPNATKEEVRAEIERLLGFSREDDNGQGDHGTYLGPGPKIAHVLSVHPDIYVGGFGDFGPEDSRPVARAKLAE